MGRANVSGEDLQTKPCVPLRAEETGKLGHAIQNLYSTDMPDSVHYTVGRQSLRIISGLTALHSSPSQRSSMPKRSNQFQRIITFITEQLAPVGATVRESVELVEQGIAHPIKREVDVLMEMDIGLGSVRVALECRDRSRPDDLQWIDGLIGKYRNLPVHKVIAVSSSGFSPSARVKAELNNIILMTFAEASETNWPAEFARLGMLKVSQTLSLHSVELELEPVPDEDVPPDARVVLRSPGTPAGDGTTEDIPVDDLVASVRDKVLHDAHEYLRNHMLEVYKTVGDLDKTALIVHRLHTSPGLFVQTRATKEYAIKSMTFLIAVRTVRTDATIRRQLLEDKAMATSAVLTDEREGGADYEVSAVQVAEKSEVKVFIERRAGKR